MISRRLSVPPERRIVRLPHTVGQVRLVSVPPVAVVAVDQCCLIDDFDDLPDTWLGDHTPESGGLWTVLGTDAITKPRIYERTTGFVCWKSGIGHSVAGGIVQCFANVSMHAKCTLRNSGITEAPAKFGLVTRWDGAFGTGAVQFPSYPAVCIYVSLRSAGVEVRLRANDIERVVASGLSASTTSLLDIDLVVSQTTAEFRVASSSDGWEMVGSVSVAYVDVSGVGFFMSSNPTVLAPDLHYISACPPVLRGYAAV